MTYRDDRDADQARIAALEHELATARGRIGELEGRQAQALVLAASRDFSPTGKPTSAKSKWLGAPLELERARRFEGGYPVDKFEDLIDAIRAHTRDRGRVELLRTSVSWWASSDQRGTGPFTCVTVSVKDGMTSLVVTESIRHVAGKIFGGFGGGLGGGGITLPIFGSIAMPMLAPLFIVGWVGGFYAASRALYKRSARKRAEALHQLFAMVEREIAQTLAAAT